MYVDGCRCISNGSQLTALLHTWHLHNHVWWSNFVQVFHMHISSQKITSWCNFWGNQCTGKTNGPNFCKCNWKKGSCFQRGKHWLGKQFKLRSDCRCVLRYYLILKSVCITSEKKKESPRCSPSPLNNENKYNIIMRQTAGYLMQCQMKQCKALGKPRWKLIRCNKFLKQTWKKKQLKSI